VARHGSFVVENNAQTFGACLKPRVFPKKRIGKTQPAMRYNSRADRTALQHRVQVTALKIRIIGETITMHDITLIVIQA
jgi:hypothetical protein